MLLQLLRRPLAPPERTVYRRALEIARELDSKDR